MNRISKSLKSGSKSDIKTVILCTVLSMSLLFGVYFHRVSIAKKQEIMQKEWDQRNSVAEKIQSKVKRCRNTLEVLSVLGHEGFVDIRHFSHNGETVVTAHKKPDSCYSSDAASCTIAAHIILNKDTLTFVDIYVGPSTA